MNLPPQLASFLQDWHANQMMGRLLHVETLAGYLEENQLPRTMVSRLVIGGFIIHRNRRPTPRELWDYKREGKSSPQLQWLEITPKVFEIPDAISHEPANKEPATATSCSEQLLPLLDNRDGLKGNLKILLEALLDSESHRVPWAEIPGDKESTLKRLKTKLKLQGFEVCRQDNHAVLSPIGQKQGGKSRAKMP